ncbi:MAG: hypothetical protein AAFS11_01105 [Planctomycetota bacterium]
MTLLLYRPVLDPLPIHGAEWAVLPAIAFLLAMTYKAVRTERPDRYWRETLTFAGLIVLAMSILSLGSWLVIEIAYRLAP